MTLPSSRSACLFLMSALVATGCTGCSDDAGGGTASTPPAGITCASTRTAADGDAARAALSGATSGTCVVLSGTTFTGPFEIGAGVVVYARSTSEGTRASITGGTAQAPAVTLKEGAQLAGVDVVDAGGVAVAVRAANARVSDVKVTGAKSAALAVLCKESATPGCATGTITVTDVTLEKSNLGLWVSGAHVAMKGGRSAEHASQGLTGAAGVVAIDGARLDLDGTTVEKNQGTGVLVDGALTTASIKNATVSENAERGVWAQRVSGTLDNPAVKLEGTQLVKNRIVGMGAVESRGIIIVGGRVAETVATPIATNLSGTENVGDGIGLFAGSTDFKLDQTALESNARAAGIIDGSDRGIIIVGGKVSASATGFKIVVQGSKGADVQVPEADRTTPPAALGVSAPKLTLPPVL